MLHNLFFIKTFILLKLGKMAKYKSIKQLCLIGLIAIFGLSACGSRKSQTLFNAATDLNAENTKGVYVVNDKGEGDIYYRIKINDIIVVQNLQNKEWGSTKAPVTIGNTSNSSTGENVTTYRIDPDGTANLPAIGKIILVGLTRREAELKLQDYFGSSSYLKDPIIKLDVVNLKVTLLGEFGKQGNYLLTKENTSLIEIIGEAGGINKTGDPRTIKIIRGDRSNPEIIYANLNDINSLTSKKLILQNNDIIYIQPTKSAALAERLQKSNNIIQPLLVVVNLAVLIFTLTK